MAQGHYEAKEEHKYAKVYADRSKVSQDTELLIQ